MLVKKKTSDKLILTSLLLGSFVMLALAGERFIGPREFGLMGFLFLACGIIGLLFIALQVRQIIYK